MIEHEYSKAAVEVLDIINHTAIEDVQKIPQSFIKFLTDISNKDYKPTFNYENQINEFDLGKKTRELLGFIYITWWCSDKEREKYKEIIHDGNIKKEEIQQQYDIYEVFKNKTENKNSKQVEKVNIVEYQKSNILKKIIDKMLSIFRNKNERG